MKLKIKWTGNGVNEKAYLINNNKKELLIKVDKKYYRPMDIDFLKGDASKAIKKLNFKFKYNLQDLIKDMIDSDIQKIK